MFVPMHTKKEDSFQYENIDTLSCQNKHSTSVNKKKVL